MRVTEPYTIFPRKLKSGKIVWYYQYRDEYGRRSAAMSTGETTKSGAMRVCRKLYNSGSFGGSALIFAKFTENFFDMNSSFWKWKVANGNEITQSTLTSYERILRCQLLPFFSEIKLTKINRNMVKEWVIWCSEKWSAKTVNNAQSVLNIILKGAFERGIISTVPSAGIQYRKITKKDRSLLTVEEISNIYKSDLWYKEAERNAFLLIAITGMRAGEACAISEKDVHDTWIDVRHSYSRRFGIGDTKTHMMRKVPVPYGFKFSFINGFAFERDGHPLPPHQIWANFCKVCDGIGIERVDRKLTVHSLRNFFISYLQQENVPKNKIMAVVGHSDATMTDWYTYWKPDMFPEVYTAQKKLYDAILGGKGD